jgi:hypothetical protein
MGMASGKNFANFEVELSRAVRAIPTASRGTIFFSFRERQQLK